MSLLGLSHCICTRIDEGCWRWRRICCHCVNLHAVQIYSAQLSNSWGKCLIQLAGLAVFTEHLQTERSFSFSSSSSLLILFVYNFFSVKKEKSSLNCFVLKDEIISGKRKGTACSLFSKVPHLNHSPLILASYQCYVHKVLEWVQINQILGSRSWTFSKTAVCLGQLCAGEACHEQLDHLVSF